MHKLFFRSSSSSSNEQKQEELDQFILIVIQQDAYDWQKIMQNANPRMKVGNSINRSLKVFQTSWNDLIIGTCTNYDQRCPIYIRRIWKNGRPTEAKVPKNCNLS